MEIPTDKIEKLRYWQDWMSHNKAAYDKNYEKFEKREKLYNGKARTIRGIAKRDKDVEAPHVRNIVSELIEAEVNSQIPQPKVTARKDTDEWRARLIENMLREELDRLPMEELNDMMERTIPVQGAAFWLVDWDDSVRLGGRVGEVSIQALNPRQIIPQEGVYTSVEDMDAVGVIIPSTKSYVERKFGISVENEGESDLQVKGGDAETAKDMVDIYTAYYRGDDSKIGRFTWVNDVVLEDLPDYQGRKIHRCQECGKIATSNEEECTGCGSKKLKAESYDNEEIWTQEIRTTHGTVIPGAHTDENGQTVPTVLPWYRPDCFPLFIQRNIRLYGQLLGDSDVDKIADQQNTINRLEKKIIDRILKAGTRITLPDRADFRVDPNDQDIWYVGNAADKNLIGVYDFRGDLGYEMNYLNSVYEEARQILGITNSFQGREDNTAKSGVAKQFSANQSAGRLESKRVLKEAAYADIFKRWFQLLLAYTDEPRMVVSTNINGDPEYTEFNRYDFLEQDADGNWYYNDDFLFSCDTAQPLAQNREQLWQNTIQSFQAGAFGDPSDPATLVYYWGRMEALHYPGAGDARKMMEDRLRQQQEMQQMMRQQQTMGAAAQQTPMAYTQEQRKNPKFGSGR